MAKCAFVFIWLDPVEFVLKSLTTVTGVFRQVYMISDAIFKFTQSKSGKFDLKSTVHQTGAGLQVPVEPQTTFVDKVHSLKHKQTGSSYFVCKIWDFWEPKRTHVDDVVSEGELEHPIQLYLRIPQNILKNKMAAVKVEFL